MTSKTYTAPKPGTVRWLAAAGHPGYGVRYAADVLAVVNDHGEDPADLRYVSEIAHRVHRGYHDELLVRLGRQPYTYGFTG